MPLGGLTVFLGFSGGGFFPAATAFAALVLCGALVLRITLARNPFAGLNAAVGLPLALLVAFAVLTLTSAGWSDSSARALLEFDRVLLYVLTLAFFGMLTPSGRRVAWGIRALAAAATIVCVSGLMTRVAADVWPIAANVHDDRLSFPVTYWNALGLLAALGIVACAQVTTSSREPRLGRVLAAAATPLLAATLLLTFSRASLALAVIGLLIYIVVGRPRALLGGLIATVPPTVVGLVFAYRADLLASERFDSAAAIAQGHDLALVLALCAIAAAAARAALFGLDERFAARPGRQLAGKTIGAIVAAAVAVVLVAAVAVDAPGRVSDQWDRFVAGDVVDDQGDTRARLTDLGNNGRLDHWRIALDGFRDEPVVGNGAGTYQLLWARDRPYDFTVNDGHSLYLEVMSEFGLVGIVLLAGVLLSFLVGVALRIRGPERDVHAAVLALIAIWMVHAGIDWDWEMPVVTLWLFALAGLSLACLRGEASGARLAAASGPSQIVRVVAALGVLVLAVTPAATVISQGHLDTAVAAFKRDDCRTAIDASLNSLDAVSVRAEPFEILAFCDIRQGQTQLALQAMDNAVSRDPNSWETHYGLAIVRAAAGLDPRPQLAIARRLNPLESRPQEAAELLRGNDPQKWKRRALRARLPIQ
ncbi:MAG TPA: O-antigen ligase family protein [Thermoleophilaceae bacterium]|nr:O-antigen ligase family protein [Thermoleophilaceae bacterium]